MSRMEFTRRGFGTALMAGVAVTALPRGAMALDLASARSLIDSAIADVNAVINSGKAEAAMFTEFERIFAKYADVAAIARSALGPAARQASAAQMKAFTAAYQGYISRKYGRRFREFIGGRIEV
ncbi:MAG: phospholipid-binding protein MlaC, partial [Gemmobacter sp.]